MQLLWTWSGKFFGYRQDNKLFTLQGNHAGVFYDDEIYGKDGKYLGEIKAENRLIVSQGKKNYLKYAFLPEIKRASIAPYANDAGYAMYAGHSDFPGYESF